MARPSYDAKTLLDPKARHSKGPAPKDPKQVANPYEANGSDGDHTLIPGMNGSSMNGNVPVARQGAGSMYEKMHNVEQRQAERTIKRQKTSHGPNEDAEDDSGHKKKKLDTSTGRSGGELGTYMKEKREEIAKNNTESSVVDLTGG